jgi:hypothetical protein
LDSAKREAETRAQHLRAAAFEVDRWASRGGSAGFSCDGRLWSGKETTMTTTERDQEIDDRLAPRLRR